MCGCEGAVTAFQSPVLGDEEFTEPQKCSKTGVEDELRADWSSESKGR